MVLDDLMIWSQCLLSQTTTHSLMLRPFFDPNIHVDASSSYGVRFTIENKYVGWQLIGGWASNNFDIGWAESVALELAIYWLIQEGYQDVNITIHSDITGVIGAFSSGHSRNPAHNDSICCITVSLILANVIITPKYIASANNLANPVLCGITLGYSSWLDCSFLLPADLIPWLTAI